MVMTFFRRGDGDSGLDLITARTVSMVSDARHSFDMASTALLSGADLEGIRTVVRLACSDAGSNIFRRALVVEEVAHLVNVDSDELQARLLVESQA